jgi:Protein of unknown function (DUF3489)
MATAKRNRRTKISASNKLRPKSGPIRKPEKPHAPKPRADSKQEKIVDLLRQPEGASIAAIAKAAGWQEHSVRGFFAGVVRKRLGLKLSSTKVDDARVYKIAAGQQERPKPQQVEQQRH